MCNHWANIAKESCAIDSFSKYTWVILIKNQKGTSIVNAFKKIISDGTEAESNGRKKPNKIWVDQSSEFYNNSFKDFLKLNNIEMYLTYSERKSVVAESEKNENKYLALDDMDENKEVSRKYEDVWEGIKKEIETINGGEKNWIW